MSEKEKFQRVTDALAPLCPGHSAGQCKYAPTWDPSRITDTCDAVMKPLLEDLEPVKSQQWSVMLPSGGYETDPNRVKYSLYYETEISSIPVTVERKAHLNGRNARYYISLR